MGYACTAGLWLPACQLPSGRLLPPAPGGCGHWAQKEGGRAGLHLHVTACQSQMHGFLLVCFNFPSSWIIHALPLSAPPNLTVIFRS